MSQRILDAVTSPADLKVLTDDDLAILADEIRGEILSVTSKNGGHVASSLGAVETILALHSLLDCPKDRILFDVGHQAYAHKLVTGRLEDFKTLRKYGGLSGFPKPSESPYDVHPSGHASDSLSVALGLAKARDLRGSDEKIVTVIGDASVAGGMAWEALNHIGHAQTPMVIVLNDNEMSISRNVGALMRHLGMMRATTQYREARDSMQDKLEARGKLGRGVVSLGRNVKESMKQFIIPHSMIYEQLGIVCTTPIDGHDIPLLREVFASVLEADGPVLVHVVTRKGEGYKPAMKDPERFHGVGPYDLGTGQLLKKAGGPPTYTAVFGDALCREAEADPDIVAMTAAMKGGTGLGGFAQKFPDRFVDTGITEGHAVGMASGIAAGGKKPFVCIYSTFLQRALDQVIIDCALPKANVKFCIDRAGVVGDDGPTHHGIFDIAYLRMVPNMRVLTPSNEAELVHAVHTLAKLEGPASVRYPRGAAQGVPLPEEPQLLEVGKSRLVREGSDVAILTFGAVKTAAEGAADLLAEQGISARVVDMRWAKPLDAQAIAEAAATQLVVTVEPGAVAGGAGEGVLEVLSLQGAKTPTLVLGIGDAFVPQGSIPQLMHDQGLDAEGIAASVLKKLRG
ncbi:MAG: 1-deoxy-D-xylulose-5-phosphate synthase [Coriobacteriia bacterium]|nr:1-deoxy-D-xylulose-5-phosphate synthase [Coriobacteriia bacterium]